MTEIAKLPMEVTEALNDHQLETENEEVLDDQNQDRHSISSDCSEVTEYTSMTEVKERASTCTLVRNI
jgi:hypothetical protein